MEVSVASSVMAKVRCSLSFCSEIDKLVEQLAAIVTLLNAAIL